MAAGGGYLANLPPSEFARRYEQQLPERMSGADFLQRYRTHWDAATRIDAAQVGGWSCRRAGGWCVGRPGARLQARC